MQTVGGTVKDSSALPIALSQAMHEMTAVQEGIGGWPGTVINTLALEKAAKSLANRGMV